MVVDKSSATYKVYKNANSLGSNSKTFGAVDFTRLFGSSGISGGNIDYGITLVYKDAHSSTDVGTISDWLNTKYSIY